MSILPSGTVQSSGESLRGTKTDDGIYVFAHAYDGQYDFFAKPAQVCTMQQPNHSGVTIAPIGRSPESSDPLE